jgi:hypothetical protein
VRDKDSDRSLQTRAAAAAPHQLSYARTALRDGGDDATQIRSIMQNAFVVPDLEAAIDHWTRIMQVGPFFLFEHIPFAELWFRGQPTKLDMTAALAYSATCRSS